MSVRPAWRLRPMARSRRVAVARGSVPMRTRTREASSAKVTSLTWCRASTCRCRTDRFGDPFRGDLLGSEAGDRVDRPDGGLVRRTAGTAALGLGAPFLADELGGPLRAVAISVICKHRKARQIGFWQLNMPFQAARDIHGQLPAGKSLITSALAGRTRGAEMRRGTDGRVIFRSNREESRIDRQAQRQGLSGGSCRRRGA